MNVKYIIAGVMAVGLIIVGVIVVSGGKIDIPGISQWVAEVEVTGVRHGFFDVDKWVEIGDVTIYRGVVWNMGPLWFGEDWRVEVTSYRGGEMIDRQIGSMTVDWMSASTTTVKVGLGGERSATIKVRLLYSDGTLIDQKSVTI